MTREFVYRDLRSNKFWTIDCKGKDVVVTNGRIGAKPRESRTAHASPAAARAAAQKQIAAKLAKGYKEKKIASLPAHVKPDWAKQRMSEDVFWDIVSLFDWKKTGDDDAVMRPALRALAAMRDRDIYRFDDILAEKLYALDTREHARHGFEGEADPDDGDEYISADEFLYLRCVVVANGRKFYGLVRRDPRKMPREMEFESLLYLAHDSYEKRTDKPYEHSTRVCYESFSNARGWKPTRRTRPGKFTSERIPPGNRRPT